MHTPFQLTEPRVRALGEGLALQVQGFATPEEVHLWSADITESSAAFTQGRTGAGLHRDTAVRGDRRAWASDLPEHFSGLRARFEEVSQELNREAWLGLGGFSIQLAIFEPGARYQAHRDALRGDPGRRVTAILYLNPAWERADGGSLRIHHRASTQDIAPRGGRLVVFLSDRVLHEVLPGHAQRHAATAWFRGYGVP